MWMQLLKSVRNYKKDSILTSVFVTVEVLMDVAIPFVMAKLIDDGINKGNMGTVLWLGGTLVVAAIISLTFGFLSGTYAARASSGFAKNLRQEMYYSMQGFSFSNIDRFSQASLITRLTTDVTNVQNAYQMIIRIAVRSPLMLFFSLIMAFTINSQLPLIYLVLVPILGVGLFAIAMHVHPIFERVFRNYDRLNRIVQENLRGIRVVKSFVREDHEIEKFDAMSQVIYKDFSTAEKILAFNSPLMQFAIYTAILLISWFGARMIVGGTMTTGDLVSLLTYTMQILMSLMMLSMVFVMIIISRASAERITEILNEKSDLTDPAKPAMEVEDGGICFEHVDFSYAKDKNRLSLMDVNLEIKPGETVGIIGGTGSSKTSLVQLIPRLYDVTGGAVKVGGRDVREYEIKALRDAVAMVLQKNEVFSGTIKENLRWGKADASDEEIERACRQAQADEFIRSFPDGYETHIEQGGTNLSGGQKQRLCIARAVLKHPKILILDDSTSAVDTHTDALIRKAFREELAGMTKLIIAQRISSIESADKIIVMEGGRINAIGNHEQLLRDNPIYGEVYRSQMKGSLDHE